MSDPCIFNYSENKPHFAQVKLLKCFLFLETVEKAVTKETLTNTASECVLDKAIAAGSLWDTAE